MSFSRAFTFAHEKRDITTKTPNHWAIIRMQIIFQKPINAKMRGDTKKNRDPAICSIFSCAIAD